MNVFVAGPRAVSKLNKKVIERLTNLINKNFIILVGDANGIDKQIQNFFSSQDYRNVKIFASNGKARNNIGEWEVVKVNVPPNIKGFDFFAAKDLEMAKAADYGFMIWNGKSRGTLNNMKNLVALNKKVLVYLTSSQQFYKISTPDELKLLLIKIEKNEPKDNIPHHNEIEQLSWFNN